MTTQLNLYEGKAVKNSTLKDPDRIKPETSLGSILISTTSSIQEIMIHIINWLVQIGKIRDVSPNHKYRFQFYLWQRKSKHQGNVIPLTSTNPVKKLEPSNIEYIYPDDYQDPRLNESTLQDLIQTRSQSTYAGFISLVFLAFQPERMHDQIQRVRTPITSFLATTTFSSVPAPLPIGGPTTSLVTSTSSFMPAKFNILPPATTPASFLNPPSFAEVRPDNLRCEGYWDEAYHPANFINQDRWSGKEEWLRRAYAVNNYLKQNRMFNQYRGFAHSRLVAGQNVGSGEYYDQAYNMCWPEGYVGHYIDDNDVMPTQRFYEYILMRYEALPPSFK